MEIKIGGVGIGAIWYVSIMISFALLVSGANHNGVVTFFLIFLIFITAIVLSATQKTKYNFKRVLLRGFVFPLLVATMIAGLTVKSSREWVQNIFTFSQWSVGDWYYISIDQDCGKITITSSNISIPYCGDRFVELEKSAKGIEFVCRELNGDVKDHRVILIVNPHNLKPAQSKLSNSNTNEVNTNNQRGKLSVLTSEEESELAKLEQLEAKAKKNYPPGFLIDPYQISKKSNVLLNEFQGNVPQDSLSAAIIKGEIKPQSLNSLWLIDETEESADEIFKSEAECLLLAAKYPRKQKQ